MKFSTNIKSFLEIIRDAMLALPVKATDFRYEAISLILSGKTLGIYADGGEMIYDTSLDVNGTEDGTVRIEAKWLYNVLSLIDDNEAEFAIKDLEDADSKLFTIKTSSGWYQIASFAGKAETLKRGDAKQKYFTAKASLLKRVADKTSFAVSLDSMRASMTGVLFEIDKDNNFIAVSTDGHRLVKFSRQIEGETRPMQVVVPIRAISLIQKAFLNDTDQEISVFAYGDVEKELLFQSEKTRIRVNTISEKYPNYAAVIPLENDKKIFLNNDIILRSIKRVEKFSTRGDIRINLSDNAVKITAQNPDKNASAEDAIPCEFKGEDMLIGFNGKFLQDALSRIDEKDILLELSSPTRAAILRPKEPTDKSETLIMLVMPVRVNA